MLNSFTSIGKWLFLIPFAAFGVMHFMNAEMMAGMVPIPGGIIWVYLTGAALLAFVISVIIGKLDKLAGILLAIMLIVFVVLLHMPGAMKGEQASMASMLKDLGLAGGALMYARGFSQDKTGVN